MHGLQIRGLMCGVPGDGHATDHALLGHSNDGIDVEVTQVTMPQLNIGCGCLRVCVQGRFETHRRKSLSKSDALTWAMRHRVLDIGVGIKNV